MVISMITFIFPIVGLMLILCILIKNWNCDISSNLKKYVFPFGFIFGSLGYSMEFGDKINDLTRYFDIVASLKDFSLNYILTNDRELLYTKDIIFYFVSRTNELHILPFITGFIVYTITFYVLFDIVKKSNRKFKTKELFMLILISIGIITPYSIIVNVRCVLSYTIIIFAIYRELIQKKRNIVTLMLYILPIGLHSSAIIIIIIRLISILFKKFKKISIAIALFLPTLIDIIYNYVGYLNIGIIGTIITNAINKAYAYLHWTEGGWATEIESSVSNIFQRTTGSIFLITIIILIIYINRKRAKKDNGKYQMINFLYFMSIFALGCLWIKTGAFWRFETMVVLFSPIVFVTALEENEKFRNIFIKIFVLVFLVFLVNLVYQARNMDILITVMNFIKLSGIKILYEFLYGIINFI